MVKRRYDMVKRRYQYKWKGSIIVVRTTEYKFSSDYTLRLIVKSQLASIPLVCAETAQITHSMGGDEFAVVEGENNDINRTIDLWDSICRQHAAHGVLPSPHVYDAILPNNGAA